MTGTFIDTIVVCTMTGLCIVMMGSWSDKALEGVQVTTDAFQRGLYFLPSQVASCILMICLVFFAFTTILGWDYYGEKMLRVFVQPEPDGCQSIPLAVYFGCVYRTIHDSSCCMDYCRYL